ncbi:MAG: glycosyltransferase family 8 protein [Planctomycetota bacterium]|nr:glycosyltransferase family 8 protein [Planctomycetota bacterium]
MFTQSKTPSTSTMTRPASQSDPLVVCATDDAYVMPLATMLYSAGENLRVGASLNVCILDGGVSEENKLKLKESLVDQPINLEWVSLDSDRLNQFQVSHHVSHTAYYRLLLAEVLPSSFSKVLYLDCDLLVRGDLVELWETQMLGETVLAVRDVACPIVDAAKGMENFRLANPYLANYQPIRNYRELGIQPDAPYFNSGVMLIDMQRWRDHQITEKLIKCLKDNEAYVWCWDQYALNVVLYDNWRPLSMQWNLGTHAFEYPDSRYSPVEKDQYQEMITDPKLVHFTTEWKPWHYGIQHPYQDDFFSILDKTAWQGWRPAKPDFSLKRILDHLIVGAIKRGTIVYRKLASGW